MKRLTVILASLCLLTACQPREGQQNYSESEVGVAKTTVFGTVVSVREVNIVGEPKGYGTLGGAGAGAVGGSAVGKGSGKEWATIGGVVAGAVIGNAIEQEMRNRPGIEYIITTENGETKTIVQEIIDDEPVFTPNTRVMIQTCSGDPANKICYDMGSKLAKREFTYQRVLSAEHLPTQIKRPQGIKVMD